MFTYADAQPPISTTNIVDGIGDRKHKRVKTTGQQGQEVLRHNRRRHTHNGKEKLHVIDKQQALLSNNGKD